MAIKAAGGGTLADLAPGDILKISLQAADSARLASEGSA